MITNLQAKQILIDNLDDIRCTSIALFLDRLIKREVFGGVIPQYRLKNKITDSYITSVLDFVGALDIDSLKFSYNYNARVNDGDKITPFTIIPTNIEVQTDVYTGEDDFYITTYGKTSKNICFYVTYMNDGDTLVPMKIINVSLIKG